VKYYKENNNTAKPPGTLDGLQKLYNKCGKIIVRNIKKITIQGKL
jgi:hypothetical protein